MSIDGKLRQLLDMHGHSYAEAEKVTGVCRETLRRLANGHKPPKTPQYLKEIAEGYKVEHLWLMDSATPKGEFEWSIRHAPPSQRLEWMLMTPAQRVKVTLDFLKARYPDRVSFTMLATACGMTESELVGLLQRWQTTPPDRIVALEVAKAIHGLTGISRSWFLTGRFSEDWLEDCSAVHRTSTYARNVSVSVVAQSLAALQRMAN